MIETSAAHCQMAKEIPQRNNIYYRYVRVRGNTTNEYKYILYQVSHHCCSVKSNRLADVPRRHSEEEALLAVLSVANRAVDVWHRYS